MQGQRNKKNISEMQTVMSNHHKKVLSEVRLIRRIIKNKCPSISVRHAKGTAYGWVDISAGKGKWRGRSFTSKEKRCLRNLGLIPGGNFDAISPEERGKFIERHMLKKVPKYRKYW